MPQSTRLLRILVTTVLLMGVVALDRQVSRAETGPTPVRDTVVVRRLGLHLVDPATGEIRWRAENRRGVSGAVTTPEGVIFASVAAADGSVTDVYVIPPGTATPEVIARVPGRAIVEGLGPTGDRLYLVEFAVVSPEGIILEPPTGVGELLLPAQWRGSAPPAVARRNTGGGILSPDARYWYRVQSTRPDDPNVLPEIELVVVDFAAAAAPIETRISLPDAEGYNSLLLAPDGSHLYVVDYFVQAVFVVDVAQGSITKAVTFGQYRIKHPPCASALSPRGDVLYVLGTGGINEGDGVLAFDTTSWHPVGHFLPGRDLHCLAVSPDGDRLYASAITTPPSLVTVDVATGSEQANITLDIDVCCAFVVTAADGAGGNARQPEENTTSS